MCGRYASYSSIGALASHFEVDDVRTEPLPMRWNVAPTLEIYSVIERKGTRRLGQLRWGLVAPWAEDPDKGPLAFNARAETLDRNRMYRDAFAKRRCIIPADGFYEWRKLGPKSKQPYFIRRTDGEPLALAGIWSYWRPKDDSDAEPLYSATIVTTVPDAVVANLHDRMPVVLEKDAWAAWLDPEEQDVTALRELLVPAARSPLETYPVSTMVNDVRNDGPSLVDPEEPADQELTLPGV